MIVIGLVLGVFLGVVLSVAVWATGRRPYLRVDVERHTTREVVHHVYPHPDCEDPRDRRAVVVEARHDRQVMPTVPARGRVVWHEQMRGIGR